MKRIYVILLIAISGYSLTSCKEKTASEKLKEKMEEAGKDIKDAADDADDAVKEESKKVEGEAK